MNDNNVDIESGITSLLSGISGEYHVAAELSQRGFIASITLRNTRGIDILASNPEAKKTVAIQVKTIRNKNYWMLKDKDEEFKGPNHFYVFVKLRDVKQRPEFYIVPNKEVATYIRKQHQKWLKTPGVKGQDRKDTPMRKFEDKSSRYLEKWELLGLCTPKKNSNSAPATA